MIEVTDTMRASLTAARTIDPDGITRYRYPSLTAVARSLPEGTAGQIEDYMFNLVSGTTQGGAPSPLGYGKAALVTRAGGQTHDASHLAQLEKARASLNASLRASGDKLTLEPAVAGSIPSIPRFLGGSPKAMLRVRRRQQHAPVVRVGFHVGRRASVPEAVAFARAAALVALTEEIERSGSRVELVAVWSNATSSRSPDPKEALAVQVTVKHPHEYYTPQTVAFALDPSFQRRVVWPHTCFEHHLFRAMDTSFLSGLGLGRPGEAKHYDYYAGYLDNAGQGGGRDPLGWYRHFRAEWKLDQQAA